MNVIQQITNDAFQTQKLVLPDGTILTITLYFVPMQLNWIITELNYGDFTLKGIRLCNSPNLLYQWKNILPFGLNCFTIGNREPSLQDDFSSGASTLCILTAAEVEAYTEFLSGT